MAKFYWDYDDKKNSFMKELRLKALLKNKKNTTVLGVMCGKAGYVPIIYEPKYKAFDLKVVLYPKAVKKAKKAPTYLSASEEEKRLLELKAACAIIEKKFKKQFDKKKLKKGK